MRQHAARSHPSTLTRALGGGENSYRSSPNLSTPADAASTRSIELKSILSLLKGGLLKIFVESQ